MKYLHALATIALIVFLVLCSYLVERAANTLDGTAKALSTLQSDLDSAHDVLADLDKTAKTTAATADEEQNEIKLSMRELRKTLAKANDLVGHADVALVGTDGRSGLRSP